MVQNENTGINDTEFFIGDKEISHQFLRDYGISIQWDSYSPEIRFTLKRMLVLESQVELMRWTRMRLVIHLDDRKAEYEFMGGIMGYTETATTNDKRVWEDVTVLGKIFRPS